MKCLGIAIKKNEVWFSLVEGSSKELANIVCVNKQAFKADSQKLMLDFHNIFFELISKYNPDRVAYKVSLDTNKQQIPYMHYSLGILNLICLQKGISTTERTNMWITAGKKAKINLFNEHFKEANYKNEALAASLIAWYELGE